MKTNLIQIGLAIISLHISCADELKIEVRCLEFSGTVPNDLILTKLVEDEGAQADKMLAQRINDNGTFKIESLPAANESESPVGWSGQFTTTGYTDKLLNLKFDFTSKRVGSPNIHEVDGEQVVTPVFMMNRFQSEIQIGLDSWRFLHVPTSASVNASRFFAIRIMKKPNKSEMATPRKPSDQF